MNAPSFTDHDQQLTDVDAPAGKRPDRRRIKDRPDIGLFEIELVGHQAVDAEAPPVRKSSRSRRASALTSSDIGGISSRIRLMRSSFSSNPMASKASLVACPRRIRSPSAAATSADALVLDER
jgi:hypothetical protein